MTFTRAARLMLALLLVGLAGAAGSAARSGADRPEQTWTEIGWPFLLDEWGAGQAFRCEDKACGLEARLFVRAKRGFCNCFQGVADDAEVDRLNLPSYTAFVMPRLAAVRDAAGEIADVEISYPCDLAAQMLEYSAATRHLTP